MNIEGRVFVVSGGGSGIGRATALAFAERGAKVIVADVNAVGGGESVRLIVDRGGIATFSHCDVTESQDLERTFRLARKKLGGLEIVFNNAGIGDEDLFADESGDWKRVVEMDLLGGIDATRLAVREMRQLRRAGVIVNTTSLIGLEPMPSAPVYGAARAGVVNFTRSLAHLSEEFGIRVNAICPEIVATPMVLQAPGEEVKALVASGKILMTEEIAAAVIELVADDMLSGSVLKITVEGGRQFA